MGIFAIIIIYLLGMVAVGLYYMKKNSSTGDYYLGGRKLGPDRNGDECGGVGYEQLAFDGTSGSCIFNRSSRRGMDGDRSGDRNLLKLADRGKKTASVYCGSRKFDHDTGVFFQPLSR